MSILNRLFRILRARVSSGERRERGGDAAYHREAREKARQQAEDYRQAYEDLRDSFNDSGSHSSKHETHEDAELAGYYANLEVPYGSDLETVRKAWKRQMARYHPDKHQGDPQKAKVANELVQQLNQAYRELEKHLSRAS